MYIRKHVPWLVLICVIISVSIFIYSTIESDTNGVGSNITAELGSLEMLKEQGLIQLPVFYLEDKSNFNLQLIKSPVVILNFWASWCGPCVEELPSLLNLVKKYNGNVALLAVSLDADLEQAKVFLKNYSYKNLNVHLLSDPTFEVAQKIGTIKLPESYILGTNRKLVKKISGAVDWMSPEIQVYIENIIAKP